ncbi:MAG: carbohydrate ABC transporter permease [Solirubrobacteraceae bacterium]
MTQHSANRAPRNSDARGAAAARSDRARSRDRREYLVVALKTPAEIFHYPPVWWPSELQFGNFLVLFRDGDVRAIWNSLVIASVSTFIAMLLGTACAYSIVRFRTGGDNLALWILSQRMLPPIVIVFPVFLIYARLGLTDTYLGLIILYTAFALPYVIWMMRGYVEDVPVALEVMETVSAVADVVRSARALAGGADYWLGPAAIAMDENPYGPSTPNPENGRVTMARMDPRQRGLFGAAWALGYLAEATRAGVDALIMSAPVGELGVVYARADYPQPYFDDLAAPAVYPIFHVLRGITGAAGSPLLEVTTSEPGRVLGLACRRAGATPLWLANLTGEPQRVMLPEAFATEHRAWTLDETSFEPATTDPDFAEKTERRQGRELTLAAYAVACLVLGQ